MGATEERELIREALQDHRREFRIAMQRLKDAARSAADPREPIRERPVHWLVGGMIAGLLLGWRA